MQPILGHPLWHIHLLNTEECIAELHSMSSTKGYFSKVRKHNQPTKYIEIKQQIRQNETTEEYVPNKGTR